MTKYQSGASRAIAILDWLSTRNSVATVSELSSDLDIPKASIYRILKELVDWGVLTYDARARVYKLGPRLLEFARSYNGNTSLTMIGGPHISHLRDITEETVSLNIVLGTERICIAEARSPHGLNWSVPPGARGPLYAGATGKVILAFMDPREFDSLRKILQLESITSATPTQWESLLKDLAQIRKDGYSITIGEVTEGVAGLAAPIRNLEGFSIGAINVSAPLLRWSNEIAAMHLPFTLETAELISREYQYSN